MAVSDTPKAHARPIFTSSNCINRRQRKVQCNVCRELCPEKVFSSDPKIPIAWDKCKNCGLCVSACPSRCFAPDAQLQKAYTHNLDLEHPVSFSCYNETQLCDRTVECLAGIPWELLATLSLFTDVVLYIGACDNCGDETRLCTLRDNLQKLRAFLGDELFVRRVHLLREGSFEREAAEEKLKSRRDIFSDLKNSVMKSTVNFVASRLPFLDEDADTDGLQYRQMLSKTVLQVRAGAKKAVDAGVSGAKMPVYALNLPVFTTKCYGCGICEIICPQKALEIGALENGKRLIYITPWKCTGCGLCVSACPSHGIKELAEINVPYLERLPLVRINSAACEKCGRAIAPGGDTLCPTCALKAKKRLR